MQLDVVHSIFIVSGVEAEIQEAQHNRMKGQPYLPD
jgi:hypothetical protein